MKILGVAGKIKMLPLQAEGFSGRVGYSEKKVLEPATCQVAFIAPKPKALKVVDLDGVQMTVIHIVKSKYIKGMHTYHLAPLEK